MAEEEAQQMNIIAVLLRVDNGGTTTVLCTKLNQDPMFPDKVILGGIVGVSFPVAGQWLKTIQWSVSKELVVNWMLGPLRQDFDISLGDLEGDKGVPWPPGVNPHQDLLSHPEEVEPFINKDEPPAPPPKKTLREATKEARAAGNPPEPLESEGNPPIIKPIAVR